MRDFCQDVAPDISLIKISIRIITHGINVTACRRDASTSSLNILVAVTLVSSILEVPNPGGGTRCRDFDFRLLSNAAI
jgi:hypothetical protein